MFARAARLVANPILVKELRAGARGARFFYAHLAVLSIFAIIFLLVAGAMIADAAFRRTDPSRVGEMLFLVTQVIQLAAIFLIVPAFAATSISSERERQTYDLLMSTTLTPAKIAWGKLAASLIQAGLIFASLVPLVSLSFMFGGVTIWQLVVNTTVLAVVATLLSSWALSVSASVQSTTRAVIGVYAGSIMLAFGLMVVSAFLSESGVFHYFLRAYGFIGTAHFEQYRVGWRAATFTPMQTFLYAGLCPLVFAGGAVVFFMINATNRLKPFFAERTAALRLFYLSAIAVLILLAYGCFFADIKGTPPSEYAFYMTTAMVMLIAFSHSSIFSCEDPVLPRYLGEQVAAIPARRWWRRLMAPGAVAGARFALAANVALLAVLFALFVPHTGVFTDPRFDVVSAGGSKAWKPWLLCVGIILLWTYLLSGAGMLLGIAFRRHQRLSRVLLFSIALLTAIVPLIYWSIVQAFDLRRGGLEAPAPWELSLSPVAAIIAALHGSAMQTPYESTFFGSRLPIPMLFAAFMLFGGTAARLLAWRRLAALQRGAA